jgi:RHS repeat-associated protein
MIQRITNLNGLTVQTNYIDPNLSSNHYNAETFEMKSEGIYLIQVSGISYTNIDQISEMKLIIPVYNMIYGTRFYAREIISAYTPSSVTWGSNLSINSTVIEAEHEILFDSGSGISAPTVYYVTLDLTLLARKWKKNQTTNTSIAIYTTETSINVITPLNLDILNQVEVLSIENARQTGLGAHLSFSEYDVGFAGTGCVNNQTGKLINHFKGFSTNSKKNSISVGAFYAQQRPIGISPLNQKQSMVGNWRSSFDYGVSKTTKRITILHPDGSVHHYDEISQEQAERYGISTTLSIVYLNFFDFSYIEEQSDLVVFDRQKNQMKLSLTGLIKEFKKADGSTVTFNNDGTKITSIVADGRTVIVTYSLTKMERVEFVEEEKCILFVYGTNGPNQIKLQDIEYVSTSTSSGGSISTKTYIDRYEASYSYIDGKLKRLIDVTLNNAIGFEFTSEKVSMARNEVYMTTAYGAYENFYYYEDYTKVKDYEDNEMYLYFNFHGQCIHKIDKDGNVIAMQYGKVSEDGTQQLLQDASAVVYNVRNRIINHSFDGTIDPISSTGIGWKTDEESAVKVVDGGVYGDKCLRVRKDSTGLVKVFQTLIPEQGEFEVSFFAKSKNALGTAIVNAKIYYIQTRPALPGEIGIDDGDGEPYVIVDSGTIDKNSSNVIGEEGWKRFVIEDIDIPTTATSVSMELSIMCEHTQGDVFFDDFQMMLPQRSTYNLIQNGYFDNEIGTIPSGWTSVAFTYQDHLMTSSLDIPFEKILGNRGLWMVGNSTVLKRLYKEFEINGGAGEEFTLVSWAKGYVLNTDIFRIRVTINYPGFDSDVFDFDFNSQTTNWQMLLRNITTSKPYSSIEISLEHQGPNTVIFDSIQLYQDASGKHYNYDEKGNLLDQMSSDKTKSSLSYDESNKVTQSVDPSGDTYKYTYGTNDKLTEIIDSKGNSINFEYDTNGNRTKSEVDSSEGDLAFEQTFNSDNKITSTKDELGNISSIQYDSKGRVYKETNPKGFIKTSTYDEYNNLIQLIQSGENKSIAHTYAYNTDQSLKSITTDNGTKYEFIYDNWGKLVQVKVNNYVFASYEHNNIKNGVETELITKQTYGSDPNESFDFSYDIKGRLQEVFFKNVTVAKYHYNDKGQVYQIDTDDLIKYFSYDRKGKLVKETDSSGKIIRFDYDNIDQVQKATFDINGTVRSYDYEYTNEFNQYTRDGLRTRIAGAFGDDIAKDYYSFNGVYGMRPDLVSSALFGTDETITDRVITLNKNSSRIIYNLSTVNSLRKTGRIQSGWFNEIEWRYKFIYNKSFFGWFKPVNLTDEKVIFSAGDANNDFWKVLAVKSGTNYIFTLKRTKDSANVSQCSLTIPETNQWIFIGLRVNKAESNTEIAFTVNDEYTTSFLNSVSFTHEISKFIVGDRSQPYGGSNEPITSYQLKVHMLSIGAYKHAQETFSILNAQGQKYIATTYAVTPQTGVSFENPELYDGLDTVTLNGSFISKLGVKPISYSFTDRSYALDKTKLFEYDVVAGKHVYGSYNGLMGMSETKGKLVYDFDLNSKGTMSIRVKPLVISNDDRTIIMNKKDGNKLFGAVLKSDNKLYMALNNVLYKVSDTTIPLNSWFTLILSWNGNQFSLKTNTLSLDKTLSVSLLEAQTVIGSDLDGFNPVNHLNGQVEMLAYKDDILEATRITKLFQNNHMMSVKTKVDILGRSTKDVIDTGLVLLENQYQYNSPLTGKTSLQVESILKYDQTMVTYAYDSLGNVISMTTTDGTYEYNYDYLNRLVREYNPKDIRTMIMSYIGNGNILAKKYYSGNQPLIVTGTPVESYEYAYNDTSWKDRLTKVTKKINGVIDEESNIAYNSNFIGNPSQFGNKTLTWEGRRLTNVNGNAIEYKYNDEGTRISKKVGEVLTTYELNGNNIVAETTTDETTRYHYNERGLLVGFEFQNKQYFYIRDLLGIITEIVDENGFVMVSYNYDAWGNIIYKVVNNQIIDEINHFVYKGYYLDNETGWFYLKTRYYNQFIGRFINADNRTATLRGIESSNLFVYGNNNPVNVIDENGNWPKWAKWVIIGIAIAAVILIAVVAPVAAPVLIGAGIGMLSSAATSVAGQLLTTGKIDPEQLILDIAIGTVLGAFGGSAIGPIGMMFTQGTAGVISSIGSDLIADRDIDVKSAIVSGTIGALMGLASKGAQYKKGGSIKSIRGTLQNIDGRVGSWKNGLTTIFKNRLKDAKSMISRSASREIIKNSGTEIVFDFIEEFTKIIISAT